MNIATGLDHVGVVARDGAALWGGFERLGFVLTPQSRQSGRLVADGPVVPWASANRCAMLRHGYIELLAIVAPDSPFNGLDHFLERYAGLHILALGMDDETGNLARLRQAGVAIPGVLHLERAVDDREPDGMRARFARLPLPDAPEGRVQLVRHLTPQAIWQEQFMAHPNRAVSLEAAILAVAEPAATAARLSVLAGQPVTPDPAGGYALTLGHGTVRILPEAALPAVLPGVKAPVLPFMAGMVISTEDAAETVRASVPGLRAVAGGWMTAEAGAAIVFC